MEQKKCYFSHSEFFYTHQNSTGACLSRNQFSGPILCLAHEVAVRGSVRILALGERSKCSQFLENLFTLSFISTGSYKVEVISHPLYPAISFTVRIFLSATVLNYLAPNKQRKELFGKVAAILFPLICPAGNLSHCSQSGDNVKVVERGLNTIKVGQQKRNWMAKNFPSGSPPPSLFYAPLSPNFSSETLAESLNAHHHPHSSWFMSS